MTHSDVAASQCRTFREWTATDLAGNTHVLTQVIKFSSPAPPQVSGERQLYIACGSVGTIYDNEYILDHQLLVVSHPCDRDLDITFQDSAQVTECGVDITREWTVKDDCGGIAYFTQDIKILKQSDPDEPEDGQINVPLYQTLMWPPYPGSSQYKVYVWKFGEEEPMESIKITGSRAYYTSKPYPPNTRLLWRVGYMVATVNGSREIPSPVWGMTTKAFADLAVTSVMAPSTAFSGTDVTIQWRVENVGNISTSASTRSWYDEVYMGQGGDFNDAYRVKRVRQWRYVDPQDGFLSETEIPLKESDIGNFYVFVVVDSRMNIDDYSRKNNLNQATAPIKVSTLFGIHIYEQLIGTYHIFCRVSEIKSYIVF